ncbi:MAG: ABC transporter ATP-binding protein [Myxococcales bacterium]|nr:ABC transporter ATP-binding protein [Myxococcales bacterium]TDJ14751.1 MAG: ABC transporter ATP-binding protein [Deltaproteobacteria bacterium]
MFALELSGVTKRYGQRTALNNIDLRLESGASLGLLGPNGAGKTTCLRLLLGFAQPCHGTVRLRGRDPMDPASRVGVAYLPERLRLPERATVRGFLRLHGTLAGLAGAELEREVESALEMTGLADRGADRIGGLSKGLAQRVGFAQAFLAQPDLLLLDEPTSGLDPIGIRDAREWIRIVRERGCTVLVSSHVLSEVERVCDHAAILHEGRIAAQGAIADLVRPDETLEDAFLRVVRG